MVKFHNRRPDCSYKINPRDDENSIKIKPQQTPGSSLGSIPMLERGGDSTLEILGLNDKFGPSTHNQAHYKPTIYSAHLLFSFESN